MPYLTAEIPTTETLTFRFFAELVSKEQDDYGCPYEWQTIDVVVTENSKIAVRDLIENRGWLKDFTLVSIWEPWQENGLPDDAPF